MNKKNSPEFPHLQNDLADIRLLGLSSNFAPFCNHTSSPRSEMYAGHLSQSLIIDGCEFPEIFTGKEIELTNYELQSGAYSRKSDGQIIDIIDKYSFNVKPYLEKANLKTPKRTVIYYSHDDNVLDYFDINSHYLVGNGFGFENIHENDHYLAPGNYIDKDIVFSHSRAIKGKQYCLGTNANVSYITDPNTIEDAMVISRTLANKLGSLEINTMSIRLSDNKYPINLYGDSENFKFLPDIGEVVNEDNVLCAFKNVSNDTFLSDMSLKTRDKLHYLHEDIIKLHSGAQIIDIDFYITKYNKSSTIWTFLQQSEKYIEDIVLYYKQVLAIYYQYKNKYDLSPKFSTLVRDAYFYLIAQGEKVQHITSAPKGVNYTSEKDIPIKFMQIDITYRQQRDVQEGFKITDRFGTKGIISKIVEDEDMPIDDFGIRADLIIDPTTVVSRMSIGQLYEQGINRISKFVHHQISQLSTQDPLKAYYTLLEYYNDVNPNYKDVIDRVKNTDEKRLEYLKTVIDSGKIYLNITPTLGTFKDNDRLKRAILRETDKKKQKVMMDKYNIKDLNIKHKENPLLRLMNKWQMKKSPVTFNIDQDGKKVKVRTVEDILIGSKYVYLLGKIPEPSSPGVAATSHYKIPIKTPKAKNQQNLLSINATRNVGEDELRVHTNSVGAKEVLRLMNVQATSPTAIDSMIRELLSGKPMYDIKRINMTDNQLQKTNVILSLVENIMSTNGINIKYMTEDEVQKMMKDIKKYLIE